MKLDWDKELMARNLEALKKRDSYTIEDRYMMKFYENYINNKTRKDKNSDMAKERPISQKKLLEYIKTNIQHFQYATLKEFPARISDMVYEILTSTGPLCSHHVITKKEYNISHGKVEEEYLIKQSYDIFESIFPGFKSVLDEIYNKKLVKIINKKGETAMDNRCFCDYINKQGFVHINKAYNLDSIEATLNHELTHSLTTTINPDIFLKNDLPAIEEAHPIYMAYYTNNTLYDKTHDDKYLKGNYNYLQYIKNLVSILGFYARTVTLKNITPRSIEDLYIKSTGYKIQDTNQLLEILADINITDYLTYFISNIVALHFLEQEPDKAKYLFIKSLYNDNRTLNNFLKNIEFDLKHPDYGAYLLQKHDIEMNKVRTKK